MVGWTHDFLVLESLVGILSTALDSTRQTSMVRVALRCGSLFDDAPLSSLVCVLQLSLLGLSPHMTSWHCLCHVTFWHPGESQLLKQTQCHYAFTKLLVFCGCCEDTSWCCGAELHTHNVYVAPFLVDESKEESLRDRGNSCLIQAQLESSDADSNSTNKLKVHVCFMLMTEN